MAHEMHMQEEGILYVKFKGDFDEADVNAYMRDFTSIMEQVTGTIHFLVDVKEVGKATSGARKFFGDVFRNPDPRIGRTAVFGASRYVRVVAGFVTRVTGADNMRMFETRDEALAWLRELRQEAGNDGA